MQITKTTISPTLIKLTIDATPAELDTVKKHTLEHLKKDMKLPGFRSGKAPLSVVEKNADQNVLQANFVEEAINHLYQKAISSQELRPLDNPKVSIMKFVPYTELSFDAEVEILGEVKLADYKKIKQTMPKFSVVAKEVDEVIKNLQKREATKVPVKRAAKMGDELVIDFTGVDSKKQPIKGAEAKDYELLLGSKSFIPGFEEELVGLKASDSKSFTLTFPKNYSAKDLANQKVTFTVDVKSVNELQEPKLDDEFAAKLGPFKTVSELKATIKEQLTVEKQTQARRQLENELIKKIVEGSQLSVPEVLVNEQIERLKTEVRQNIAYRGQTWQEMLEAESKTEEEFIKSQLKPEAERRVKTGLVLAEISMKEKLEVSPEEVAQRIQELKMQYQDQAMRAELDKPEAEREMTSRLLTEKTVQYLVEMTTKK